MSNTYTNKVQLADGTTIVDLTGDDVTAADVAQGKIFHLPTGEQATGTASGGGTTEPDPLDVDFVDYDGTLLYTYTAAEFANLQSLPPNPTHTGLVAQGWNWTLSDAKTHVSEYGSLVIGQNYKTSDGRTRVYITVTEDILGCAHRVYFYASVKGGVTVHWGDGTSTVSTANANAYSSLSHTYNSAGDYVIELEVTSGTLKIGYDGASQTFINGGSSSAFTDFYAVRNTVKKIEIGDNVIAIHRQCFNSFSNCETISVPNTITSMSSGTSGTNISSCIKLKCFVIPSGVTLIPPSFAENCYALKYCSIPKSVTTISTGAFRQLSKVRKLTISNMQSGPTSSQYLITGASCMEYLTIGGTYTQTSQYFCRDNRAVVIGKFVIPSTVTTIPQYSFNTTFFKEIHLKQTTPPTLSNANAFSAWSNLKIYVPYSADHSILNAYKTATNWSTFESYMQEETS